MKQAVARNLNDPQLSTAPVIPTDRVGLDRLPEEDMAVVTVAVVMAVMEVPFEGRSTVEGLTPPGTGR